MQSNPVVGVRKPSAKRQRAVAPPSVALVERMRAQLLADRRQRDATLLVVLAYAGLRPQEALALPWHNVRDRTLLVDRAQSDEGPKTTKTGRTRSVRLLAPLAADLAAWRMASERSDDDELVFPTPGGGLWRDHDWRNWRRRIFDPLATRVGAQGMRPYDLRHAFCSLLIAEGASVVEVARQAGHAPTMTLDTYAHVMADLDGAERMPAEARIRAAREAEVSGKCPPEVPNPSQPGQNPSVSSKPTPGLEPGTPSLRVRARRTSDAAKRPARWLFRGVPLDPEPSGRMCRFAAVWSPSGHPNARLIGRGVAVRPAGCQDCRNEKDRGDSPGLSVSC